jgi:hypothetical protein
MSTVRRSPRIASNPRVNYYEVNENGFAIIPPYKEEVLDRVEMDYLKESERVMEFKSSYKQYDNVSMQIRTYLDNLHVLRHNKSPNSFKERTQQAVILLNYIMAHPDFIAFNKVLRKILFDRIDEFYNDPYEFANKQENYQDTLEKFRTYILNTKKWLLAILPVNMNYRA